MNKVSSIFHRAFIYDRRMSQLHKHLSEIISEFKCKCVLDIGAGDGKIDKMIEDAISTNITGIDVLVRDETYIPITEYDGTHINSNDNSIEATMMIDVLHHTEDPSVVFKEAVRVSNKYIIIKDHILSNKLSYLKLKAMDYVGNKHYSVNLPYNYLTKKDWDKLFEDSNVEMIMCKTNLKLYGGIFHLLFDRNLHFIAVLKKGDN